MILYDRGRYWLLFLLLWVAEPLAAQSTYITRQPRARIRGVADSACFQNSLQTGKAGNQVQPRSGDAEKFYQLLNQQ